MKDKTTALVLTLLAIVFTVALTFATIELPRALNRLVDAALGIPHFHTAIEPDLIEAFMRSNHVRAIGYASLVVVGLLIVAGFVVEKRGISSLGAIVLFMPTFGHFVSYMFFLAGLGVLRVLWLPVWEPSFDLLRLGDIVYLPYVVVVYPLELLVSLVGFAPGSPVTWWLRGAGLVHHYWGMFRLDVRMLLAYLLIVAGLAVFLSSTLAWLYARLRKRDTVDFWLYKHSRHPQYLGWILWSYGVMLRASLLDVPLGGANPSASLPWVLSTVAILCVALMEELRMTRAHGETYTAYRDRTPFMLPLPRSVSAAISYPMRVLLRRDRPENGWQVLVVFLVYAAILVLLSLPFVLLKWPSSMGWMVWPYDTWPLR
jgi:protein-S-isoprenylcysteine O-methyltransferase Ste14